MGEKVVYRPMCDLFTGLWYVQRGWRRIDGTTYDWKTVISTGKKHEEGYNAAEEWVRDNSRGEAADLAKALKILIDN